MLEETIKFCHSNAGSSVQDIRFAVYQQDQKLTAAFKQEVDKLAAKYKSRVHIHSTFRPRAAGRVSIEVPQGDLNVSQQEHKKHSTDSNQSVSSPVDVDEKESEGSSLGEAEARAPRQPQRASHEHSVKISVIGKSKASVEQAVESLKRDFSEACTMQQVENEVISQLSQKQINSLRRKADDRDVILEVEAVVNRIAVRGQPTEVSSMVQEIWKEINERTKRKQEEEQALLLSKDIEWSYVIHGNRMFFGSKANAKIEMAYRKDEPRVQVSLRAERFVIDLKTKTGRGQKNGEQITLSRKIKGAEEGK